MKLRSGYLFTHPVEEIGEAVPPAADCRMERRMKQPPSQPSFPRGVPLSMKAALALLAMACLFPQPAAAADTPKPQVTLTVKRQVLDSDHDLRRKQGSTAQKTLTLRVEIANVSSSPLAASELTGEVLVKRASGEKEQIVKEKLGKLAVPVLKPNEKTTLDLGKITLTELEWGKQKFEEELEEWKVTCTLGQVVLGTAESSDKFAELEKTAVTPRVKEIPQNPTKKRIKRLVR